MGDGFIAGTPLFEPMPFPAFITIESFPMASANISMPPVTSEEWSPESFIADAFPFLATTGITTRIPAGVGTDISEISVPTPAGIRAVIPVVAKNGKASAIKDSGDHSSDVTGGIEILAEAIGNDSMVIKAGNGIGSKRGVPAINPSPMHQIEEAVRE